MIKPLMGMSDEAYLALPGEERANVVKAAWLELVERDKEDPKMLRAARERIQQNRDSGKRLLDIFEPMKGLGRTIPGTEAILDEVRAMQGALGEVLAAIDAALAQHESH